MKSSGGKFFNQVPDDSSVSNVKNNSSANTNNNVGGKFFPESGNSSYNRPKDYSNLINTLKDKKMIYAFILLVLLIVVVLYSCSGEKKFSGTVNGTTIEQGDELVVDNDITDAVITFNDAVTGVKIKDSSSVSPDGNNLVDFVKIKVKVKNGKKSFSFYPFTSITLMDEDKNEITDCFDKTLLFNFDVKDAIDTVEKNSTGEGYLYCRTDSTDGKLLEISTAVRLDPKAEEEGIVKTLETYTYYVRLK